MTNAELDALVAQLRDDGTWPMFDAADAITQLRAERDAAFKMSKCECGPDECCANLAKLHNDLAAARKLLADAWAWFIDDNDLEAARRIDAFLARDPAASKDHDLARQDAPEPTPMTGEQISQLWSDVAQNGNSVFYFARAVEAHHGIGPARGE